MVRLNSVLRLASRIASGNDSAFSRALMLASAKPRPPSPPAFTPQQTVSTTPQLNWGAPFQPINTNHTPTAGYGVYSPEYLQQLELNSEPPVYGPTVPESFDSPSFEPLNFDPLNRNDVFLPVDNVAEQEPVIDEESAEQAQGLADEIAEGKGLDLVGDDELSREDVVERLEAGGYEVESAEWGLAGDNVTRTTITDPGTGETIHEYYDHDTDRYWIEVTGEDGETLSQSPVRDDEGRKVTVSEDEESGERSTRLEDDLGDGSVVEITELTGSDVVTITTTDSDGNSETVVVAEDGTRTTLDPEQDTSRGGVDEIVDGVANGQSIEEIAEEQGLTREQVIAQLAAAGFEVDSGVEGQGPNYTDITRITESGSGDLVVSHETGPDGTQTSRVIDNDGNETRRTENTDGSTTNVLIESDGRVTETVVDTDGKTTTTVTYEQNGMTVEEVTIDDGKTTTMIIDDDGNRTELDPEQDTSREGIDEIAEAVSEGKSIDSIAEEMGLDPAQIIAQLAAAGFEVSEYTEPDDSVTRRIVDADSGEEIARYRFTMGEVTQSTFFVDAQGNEVQRTEYRNGRSIETVVEANGRRTVTSESADGEKTVSVTHNGYTVTTPPEGDITVRHDEKGMEVDVERGTYMASLIDTLLEIDPDSDDADEAKASEIVMEVVESLIAGEAVEDQQAAINEKQEELATAMDAYGKGFLPSTNVSVENPYGDPPPGQAPSGGEWVPMYDKWHDPEVAKAMAALNVLLVQQMEANDKGLYHQEQQDVYALDPEYEDAIERAGEILDEALAPHGRRWVRPEPEGSLEEAEERLREAESRLEEAGEAKREYQEAERLLGEAITTQDNMPFYPDGTVPVISEAGSGYNYSAEVEKGKEAQAEVDALFSKADFNHRHGDSLLADYVVDMLEQHPDATDSDSEISVELEKARDSQEEASRRLELSQAYLNYYNSVYESAEFTVEIEDIKSRLLAEYNGDNPHLFEEGRKHKTLGGTYLGEFTVQELDYRDGQVWVVNHFDTGKTTEQQLTVDPDDSRGWNEDYRQRPLNVEWHELNSGVDMSENICRVETPAASVTNLEVAHARLYGTLGNQLGLDIENVDDIISELEDEEQSFIEVFGEGEEVPPEDLLKPGEEPITVPIGEGEIKISLSSSEDYDQGGLEILAERDEWVEVKVEENWVWVHADQAITMLALKEANNHRDALEEAQSNMRSLEEWYRHRASQPVDLFEERESPEQEARMQFSYLVESTDRALEDIYNPRFRSMLENENVSRFQRMENEDNLRSVVKSWLNVDPSSSEGKDVVDSVVDEIYSQGGESPEVKVVPFFYVDNQVGMVESALFSVKKEDGELRYVDASGKHFSDLEDFQNHNRQFDQNGLIVAPEGLDLKEENGNISLDVVQARNVSTAEKIVDPLIGIGTGIASVGMMIPTPLAPVFAGATLLGTSYLGGRAIQNQVDHIKRGGEWGEKESWMNMGMIATTFLPIGSGMSRAAGFARFGDDISIGRAFFATMGMSRPGATTAKLTDYMHSASGWNLAGRMMDGAAIGTGMPVMAVSVHDLVVYGDQMSDLQKADAIIGLGTGFAGTVTGAYGVVVTRPTHSKPSPHNMVNPRTSAATPSVAGKPGASGTSSTFVSSRISDLRPVEIKALTDAEVGSIAPEHLSQMTPGRTTAFTRDQVALFSKEKIGALTDAQVKKLTLDQIRGLSTDQMSYFSRDQLAVMRPKQIAAMSGDQVGALSASQLRVLSDVQLQAVSTDALVQIKGNRLMWLLPEQVTSLTPSQVSALTTRQIASLTPGQVAAMDQSQVSALSSQQWRAFNPNQLRRLDSELLQLASPGALDRAGRPGTITHALDAEGSFVKLHGSVRISEQGILLQAAAPQHSKDHVTCMLVIERDALVPLLNAEAAGTIPSDARIRVQAKVYVPPVTRTPMETAATGLLTTSMALGAGVGYTGWVPAQAGAFLVRGASIATRSLLPNHTAVNTKLGRILRGVEAVTFSINLPQSYISTVEGNGVVASGSFAFANSFYMSKGYMEAITGRPFMPHVDDIGSPFYILGSNDIALASFGDVVTRDGTMVSYIDALSGGMFIYGTAAGWVQAPGYQAKGQGIPGTPEINHPQVALYESTTASSPESGASDKPKAKRDYTTAITFGGGLGLFSLSTVLADMEKNKKDDGQASIPEKYGEPRPQWVVQPPDNPSPTFPSSSSSDQMPLVMVEGGGGVLQDAGNFRSYDVTPVEEGAVGGRFNPYLVNVHEVVVVQKGQTLGGIARHYGYDVREVVELNMNHIPEPGLIAPGDHVYLPRMKVS